MHTAELLPVGDSRPIQIQADSIQQIDWLKVRDVLGRPVSVLLDYDQAMALATHEVPEPVSQAICRARDIGAIERFGIASDNPFAGLLSGMRKHTDYSFGPYVEGGRLITKANPLFYHRIIEELDIESSRLLMVGHDYRRDILNAQEVGISTIQVPPLGTLYQGLVAHRGRRLTRCARRIVRSLPVVGI